MRYYTVSPGEAEPCVGATRADDPLRSQGPGVASGAIGTSKRKDSITRRAFKCLLDGKNHHLRLLPVLLLKRGSFPSPPTSPLPQPESGPDFTAQLPDEVLLRVFQHVPPPELVCSVQHVSERWARIAQDDSLWRDYEYAPLRGTPTRDIVTVLRQSPHLRAFTLPAGADANAALDVLSNRCRQLRRLNIDVAARLNVRVLKSLFTRIPALEQLQLSQRPRVSGATFKRLALKFKPPRDQHMDMSYFYESLSSPVYRNQTYMFISKYVLKYKKNDIDQLRCNFVSDEMLTLIEDCEGLKKLRLEFDQYQDTLKKDLQFIRDFEELESLELINYHNDNVLNEIFSKGSWPKLKELDLSWSSELSDRTCKTIFLNCPNLEKIVVQGCPNVSDKGIGFLLNCEALRYVKLSSCPLLTTESVRLASRIPNLTNLDLTNFLGPVSDYLPHVLRLKHLKVLSLKGCIITRDDISELVLHLKHTKLLIDPPQQSVTSS